MIGILSFFSCEEEVAVPVVADFSIKVVNDDFSVPVHITFNNKTEGADTYRWTFEEGIPSSSEKENPGTVVFNREGNFSILLEAENRDGSKDSKEIFIPIKAEVIIGFSSRIIESNFPPMEVEISNNSNGVNSFRWIFKGGLPSSSTLEHPEIVRFENPGTYEINLEVSNGMETYQTSQTLTVAPHLSISFDYELAFEDFDREVPAILSLQSSGTSVTDYSWTFTGASPAVAFDANPQIIISESGTQTLLLTASNGKESQTISKSIHLLPNTNLQSFTDLRLGINTAHHSNNIGALFSAKNRKVFVKNEVTETNGSAIDLVFFGLNDRFGFNKFISPQHAQSLTFEMVPNASHTKIINRLENCNCSASLTSEEFDNIQDDSVLKEILIEESSTGSQDFDLNVLPRIVLFETEDGRKGAVKIKSFVADGQASFVVADVKVMKEHRE